MLFMCLKTLRSVFYSESLNMMYYWVLTEVEVVAVAGGGGPMKLIMDRYPYFDQYTWYTSYTFHLFLPRSFWRSKNWSDQMKPSYKNGIYILGVIWVICLENEIRKQHCELTNIQFTILDQACTLKHNIERIFLPSSNLTMYSVSS